MRASARFKAKYRNDPAWRLGRINRRRVAAGKDPLSSLPVVGEMKRAWASARDRDDRGRFRPETEEGKP
jgi:hypothetical protein